MFTRGSLNNISTTLECPYLEAKLIAPLSCADGSTRGSLKRSLTTSNFPFSDAKRIALLLIAEGFTRGSASKSFTISVCPFLDAKQIAPSLIGGRGRVLYGICDGWWFESKNLTISTFPSQEARQIASSNVVVSSHLMLMNKECIQEGVRVVDFLYIPYFI